MGFSIVGCILSGQMAICYSITLLVYAEVRTHCNNYNDYGYDTNKDYDCYGRYGLRRATAENLAGFGSCPWLSWSWPLRHPSIVARQCVVTQ